MREEGLSVAYAKRRARCSSYKGEISDALESLVNRHFRVAAPNGLWVYRHRGVRATGRQSVPALDSRLFRRRPARLVDRYELREDQRPVTHFD